jgi:hypothetical protein
VCPNQKLVGDTAASILSYFYQLRPSRGVHRIILIVLEKCPLADAVLRRFDDVMRQAGRKTTGRERGH